MKKIIKSMNLPRPLGTPSLREIVLLLIALAFTACTDELLTDTGSNAAPDTTVPRGCLRLAAPAAQPISPWGEHPKGEGGKTRATTNDPNPAWEDGDVVTYAIEFAQNEENATTTPLYRITGITATNSKPEASTTDTWMFGIDDSAYSVERYDGSGSWTKVTDLYLAADLIADGGILTLPAAVTEAMDAPRGATARVVMEYDNRKDDANAQRERWTMDYTAPTLTADGTNILAPGGDGTAQWLPTLETARSLMELADGTQPTLYSRLRVVTNPGVTVKVTVKVDSENSKCALVPTIYKVDGLSLLSNYNATEKTITYTATDTDDDGNVYFYGYATSTTPFTAKDDIVITVSGEVIYTGTSAPELSGITVTVTDKVIFTPSSAAQFAWRLTPGSSHLLEGKIEVGDDVVFVADATDNDLSNKLVNAAKNGKTVWVVKNNPSDGGWDLSNEVTYALIATSKRIALCLTDATTIYKCAFNGCKTLQNVSLPKATQIDIEAFNRCSSLKSITLPAATKIGNYAFFRCSSLTSIRLPEATEIGTYAFNSCSSLTSIELPEATQIGDNAFSNCSSLKSIRLPKATQIGTEAFYYCSSLTSINLPTATTITFRAFKDCEALQTLTFGAPITKWAHDALANAGTNNSAGGIEGIALTLAAGQMQFSGDNDKGFTITETPFDFESGTKTFCGYTFQSITKATP